MRTGIPHSWTPVDFTYYQSGLHILPEWTPHITRLTTLPEWTSHITRLTGGLHTLPEWTGVAPGDQLNDFVKLVARVRTNLTKLLSWSRSGSIRRATHYQSGLHTWLKRAISHEQLVGQAGKRAGP